MSNCEEKIKTNPKCFFAFTKSLRRTNCLPNTMKYMGIESSDGSTVCNLFARYFNSVFNPVVEPATATVLDPFVHQSAACPRLTRSFNVKKVSSPDGIPMMFFMHSSLALSLPLCILFNRSMVEKTFPTLWKISFVSPIFKDGDKSEVANYRPVSILCAMSKVFERLIFNKLFEEIKSKIHCSQHGFYAKRSTQTNIMEYVSTVADAIVNGGQVDTVYTDFAKAFDKVDHTILLRKLIGFGISDNMQQWFSSYLRNP